MPVFKDLVHVSVKEVEPCWEDFAELQNLYLEGSPVIIGHRGNLYSVSVCNEHDVIQHPYERVGIPVYLYERVRVSIFDIMNNMTAGNGTFDMAFYRTHDSYLTPKVREAVQDAIIKINMKPTDFYK